MTARSSSDAPAPRPSEDATGVPLLQLQEEHARLKATLEALPDILFVVDRDGRIYDFHTPHPEWLYVSPEKFLGRKMGELLPEPAASVIRAAIDETVEKGHHQGGVYPLTTPAGEHWFEMSIAPQGDPRTPEGRLIFLARDITDRKEAETDLEDAHAWLKATLKALPDILFVVDRDGRILDYHAPRQSMMLIPPEQFLGKAIPEVVSESSAKILRDALRRVAAEGPQEGVVFSIPLPEGERWYEASIAAQGDPRAPDVRFIAIVRDIHDRKRAKDALRESEERFAQSARQSRTYLWEVDANGLYTFVSPVVEDVLGYRPEELVGNLHFYDLFPGKNRAAFKTEVFETIRRRQSFRDYENPCQAKDGRVVWVITSAIPLLNEDGTLHGYRGSDTDISARKRAEEALRESEERFDQSAQQSRTVIWEVDADGLFTFVSHVVEDVLGYRPEELVGKRHFYDLYPEENRETLKTAAGEIFRRREAFRNFESMGQAKDGRSVWVVTNGIPLLNADGTLRGYRGGNMDITGRKQAEETLRESEAKYRRLHEGMRDAFLIAAMEGRLIECNPAFEALVGYSRDEVARLNYADITPAKWRAVDALAVQRVLRYGNSDVTEKEYIRKDGAIVPVEMSGTLIRDPSGKPVGISAIIRDITERKRIENELQSAHHQLEEKVEERTAALVASQESLAQSEAQFRQMTEIIQEVFFLVDAPTGRALYISPAFEQIWGRPPRKDNPGVFAWIEGLHPEDQARALQTFKRGLEAGQFDPLEVRVLREDGSVRWIDVRGWLIQPAAGKTPRVAGVMRDITERRRLEAEILNASETERQRIGRDLHDTLGQSLTGIGYLAEALREELARNNQPEAAEAEKLAHLIEEAASKSHAMARGLLVDLKGGGLAPALQELAFRTQELFGVACRYEGLAEADLPDANVAGQLYRIAQEAATNAAKHGKGKTIEIGLANQPDGLRLSVRDTGKGLPKRKKHPPGMGLEIMRHRAGMIGATLWIDSAPNRGTTVNCLLPRAVLKRR